MPPSLKYFDDEVSPDAKLIIKINQDLPLAVASMTGEDDTHVVPPESVSNDATPKHEYRSSGGSTPVSTDSSKWPFALRLFQRVWNSGFMCVLISAFLQSICALVVKLSSAPVFQLIAVRGVMCTLLTTISIYASQTGVPSEKRLSPWGTSWRNRAFLFLRGFLGMSAMVLYFFSIKLLPLADAVVIFFTSPLFVAIQARLFLKEKLTKYDLGAAPIALLGVLLVAHPSHVFGSPPKPHFLFTSLFGGHPTVSVGHESAKSSSSSRLLGAVLALSASVVGGGALTSVRYVAKLGEKSIVIANYFHMATCLAVFGLIFGAQEPVSLKGIEYLYFTIFTIGSYVAQIFVSRGFVRERAARASAANYTQVLWSELWDIIIVGETTTFSTILGAILITGSLLTSTILKAKKATSPQPYQALSRDDDEPMKTPRAEVELIVVTRP